MACSKDRGSDRRGRSRPDAPVAGCVLAWGLWALVLLAFTRALWLGHLLRQAGRPDLVSGIGETVPYLLGLVSAATVGAVLASRRPRHPVGWLLLALGLSLTFTRVAEAYARYGLLARPGAVQTLCVFAS